MTRELSPRLAAIVDALPLRPGMRILEVGCGPGAAARAVACRIGDGHVLAIDRSDRAIRQARAASVQEIASGRMEVRHAAIEEFGLLPGEAGFDLVFAIRVGALDGRHPEIQGQALERIARALAPGGRLFIDGGSPLREIEVPDVARSADPDQWLARDAGLPMLSVFPASAPAPLSVGRSVHRHHPNPPSAAGPGSASKPPLGHVLSTSQLRHRQ